GVDQHLAVVNVHGDAEVGGKTGSHLKPGVGVIQIGHVFGLDLEELQVVLGAANAVQPRADVQRVKPECLLLPVVWGVALGVKRGESLEIENPLFWSQLREQDPKRQCDRQETNGCPHWNGPFFLCRLPKLCSLPRRALKFFLRIAQTSPKPGPAAESE